MNTKINYKALAPYFICMVTYLFAAIVNIEVVNEILVLKEASSSILDKVYHYDILGYVVAGLTLFIFGNYLGFRKIIIFNLLIYIASVFSAGFFEFSGIVQKIYPMIYSGTNLLIITTLLCYIFDSKKLDQAHFLSFFIFSFSIAYFLAHLVLYYKSSGITSINLTSIRELIIINIISAGVFLFAFILNPCFHIPKHKTVNSLIVLKNVDLELLVSFTIFYIIMTIFYSYETYQLTDTLLTISVSKTKYYIFILMFLASAFVPKFAFKYNLHKINILCITSLLFTLLSMPFWSTDIVLSTVFWFIIAAALYLLFCSNLLILAAKFTHFYLQLAIILYMLAGSIGYYCSYIVADNVESADDEYNFLTSICLVLVALLIYYLYRYKKSNLGKW